MVCQDQGKLVRVQRGAAAVTVKGVFIWPLAKAGKANTLRQKSEDLLRMQRFKSETLRFSKQRELACLRGNECFHRHRVAGLVQLSKRKNSPHLASSCGAASSHALL